MKIAIFGATGGTGNEFMQQALDAGHTVQVLVRPSSELSATHPGLTSFRGDVLNPEDVGLTVAGCDAVFCSLGNTKNNPDDVVSQGTANIIEQMKARSIDRLVVISSLGVGDSKDQVPFFFKVLAKTVLRGAMKDKEKQEALVRESGLDWTIIRPGGLSNDPARDEVKVGTDGQISAEMVPRANVAAFGLEVLTENSYLEQTPAIT